MWSISTTTVLVVPVARSNGSFAQSEHSTPKLLGRAPFAPIYPYLTGVPHRIGYLEELYAYITKHTGVLMWTGEQILDWYRGVRPAGQR